MIDIISDVKIENEWLDVGKRAMHAAISLVAPCALTGWNVDLTFGRPPVYFQVFIMHCI